jgi:cell shape-determining protein MreC
MKGKQLHVVGRMIQGGSFLSKIRNAGRQVQSFGQKLHTSASSKVSSFRDKLNSMDVKKQMQALPAHLQQTGMQNTIVRELKQKGDFLRKNNMLTSGGNIRGSGMMDPLASVRTPSFATKKGGSRNNIRINL